MHRIIKTIVALALVLAMVIPFTACSSTTSKVTINVLNWGDYIDPDLIDQFEEEYGINVKYSTLTSNEEMLVKLTASDCIYDLCIPSDYVIEKLIGQDLLAEIDMDKLPNISNINPEFLDLAFDPGNKYSVPYFWGTLGILYNTTMVDPEDDVASWDILWNEKYAGKIIMYDSVRDTVGMALARLGYSINSTNEDELREAQESLIEQKPLTMAYLTDDCKMEMINGNAALCVTYSGDALEAMAENEDLAYVVPAGGGNYWFDNMVIPKTSEHYDETMQFINFLLDAEVAAQNAEYICYCTPNSASLAYIDPEMVADETFNPSEETISRLDVYHDLGDFISVYNDVWTKVKQA